MLFREKLRRFQVSFGLHPIRPWQAQPKRIGWRMAFTMVARYYPRSRFGPSSVAGLWGRRRHPERLTPSADQTQRAGFAHWALVFDFDGLHSARWVFHVKEVLQSFLLSLYQFLMFFSLQLLLSFKLQSCKMPFFVFTRFPYHRTLPPLGLIGEHG